ncbi:MAG: hypothetical protein HY422_01645 [Candidatus Komeilibacteria bacterium]|nr:hypothetical protein [Candidatus Komeilibacteria bacterium]
MTRRTTYATMLSLFIMFGIAATSSAQNERARTAADPDQQTFASVIGQRMAAYLQNIRSSLERSAGLPDTEKKNYVGRVAKDISSLQGQTAAIGRAEDQALLKQRMQELRDSWTKLERSVKFYVSVILSNNVRFAIERLEGIEEKTNVLVSRLPDDHQNREAILELQQEFSDHLTAARDAYRAAQDLFGKLESAENASVQSIFKDGQDKLKEAHTSLRQARQSFRSLLQNLKQSLPYTATPSSTAPSQP